MNTTSRPDLRAARIRNKTHHIIDLIRTQRALSKIQIKHLSGYSMSTVIAIVEQLVADTVIEVTRLTDGTGNRGPKSTYYQLRTHHQLYYGITFNQAGIYSALVSFSGAVIAVFSEPVDLDAPGPEFLAQFQRHIQTHLNTHPLKKQVVEICVSLPGLVDPEAGVLRSYTFMPTLQDVAFGQMLTDLLPGIPQVMDNNMAGFLGHLLWDRELTDAYPTIAFISLRSGLANGVIHKGTILTRSGEIGHMQVSDDRTPCICGRTGCLDLFLSHKRLSEALTQAIPDCRQNGKNYLDVSDIVAMYKHSHAGCRDIVDQHMHHLAPAILDTTNVLAPDLIILTGDLFRCYEDPAGQMTRWIQTAYPDTGYIRHFSNTRIVYRQMGTETSAIGLCYSAIRRASEYILE